MNSPIYETVAASPAPRSGRVTVSVILPVYNCGADLKRCFDALGAMCLEDSEVIVIDDGSADDTLQVALDGVKGLNSYLVIRASTNGGVARARNAALKTAVGEYVWFVDWDDVWDVHIVEKLLTAARRTSADMVVCRATRNFDENSAGSALDGLPRHDVFSRQDAFDHLLVGGIRGYLWSKLIRRDMIPPDPFPPMSSLSDLAGFIPILMSCGTVASIPDILYKHIVRPGSITNSKQPDLENIYRCRDEVRRVAGNGDRTRFRTWALLYYDAQFMHLAAVNTALRLSASDSALRSVVGRAKRELKWRDLLAIAVRRPSTALRAGLVKSLGYQYRYLYFAYTGLREKVWRRP